MSSSEFMDELESMARLAVEHDAGPAEADDITIQKWQALFGYSYSEAAKKIEGHRRDMCRNPVTDARWDLVRDEKQAQGYDKEAYEHACLISQQTRVAQQEPFTLPVKAASKYLLKMEGPLHSIEAIRAITRFSDRDTGVSELRLVAGTDDSGLSASFCIVDAATKQNIQTWLSSAEPLFQPIFVRYSKADKALSSTSHFPTIGLDTTLPQHRLGSDSALPSPAQDEYPVWYFFYGTLRDPAVLRRVLQLNDDAELLMYRPAKITGGVLTQWGGKYMALVDATEMSTVVVSAFLVLTSEQEDVLRCYETDKYEVVRCEIRMLDDNTVVKGLTWRFIST
ncbi:hypothetical protein C8A03DRAFT_34233 [Achaetomium macrosporum]|uniref:Putative gamma-glutamylcyclotransferase n=1 Tax=Achaetomium macrosporum TaxID=79813 RepID=A0AAN7C9P9_9PEZI|nr:hypothetical protein C8A03DRAFT_34233 [Achaetomium macrosporum]